VVACKLLARQLRASLMTIAAYFEDVEESYHSITTTGFLDQRIFSSTATPLGYDG
jgi:hypothetical protein